MGAKGTVMFCGLHFAFPEYCCFAFGAQQKDTFSIPLPVPAGGTLFTSMDFYWALCLTIERQFEWEKAYEDYLDARF